MSEMPDGKRYGGSLFGAPRGSSAHKPGPLPKLSDRPGAFSQGIYEAVRRTPRAPLVTVGDQTYREIDNGQANVLVPTDLRYTPSERAAQRAALQRAPSATLFNNPAGRRR
jgi:hypothetical protein